MLILSVISVFIPALSFRQDLLVELLCPGGGKTQVLVFVFGGKQTLREMAAGA